MDIKKIIVIDGSAGGIQAATQLAAKIPPDLPVTIFVVIHMAKTSSAEIILQQLQNNSSYKCVIPKDNEAIKYGHLYLAPPDLHLLIKRDVIRLIKEPHETAGGYQLMYCSAWQR